jgi:hypothetical protein
MAQQQWWVGFWGNWPGELQGWLIGADLDGPGSAPKTNIAPGIGFPTGWQNVSVAFGPTRALAIGAEIVECQPTPAKQSTWGIVKALYASRHWSGESSRGRKGD